MELKISENDIVKAIEEYLSPIVGLDDFKLTESMEFTNGNFLDSIQLIQFLFFLEERFNIHLDIEYLSNNSTFRNLIDFIVRK